jgi:hypothetical protein
MLMPTSAGAITYPRQHEKPKMLYQIIKYVRALIPIFSSRWEAQGAIRENGVSLGLVKMTNNARKHIFKHPREKRIPSRLYNNRAPSTKK